MIQNSHFPSNKFKHNSIISYTCIGIILFLLSRYLCCFVKSPKMIRPIKVLVEGLEDAVWRKFFQNYAKKSDRTFPLNQISLKEHLLPYRKTYLPYKHSSITTQKLYKIKGFRHLQKNKKKYKQCYITNLEKKFKNYGHVWYIV